MANDDRAKNNDELDEQDPNRQDTGKNTDGEEPEGTTQSPAPGDDIIIK